MDIECIGGITEVNCKTDSMGRLYYQFCFTKPCGGTIYSFFADVEQILKEANANSIYDLIGRKVEIAFTDGSGYKKWRFYQPENTWFNL